jgi:hypothetical protein
MQKILISSALLLSIFLSGNSLNSVIPKLSKDPVKKVIAAMTLEEKASLVVGAVTRNPVGQSAGVTNTPGMAGWTGNW